MNGKPWFRSQTILGLIATAVSTVGQVAGRALAPEDIQAAVQGVSLAGQAVGLLWAAWGRWRASGPLTTGNGAGAVAGCIALVLGLSLTACGGRLPGADADNKITTTTTYTDGRVETRVEEISDATAYIKGQVAAKKEQKPLWEMAAQDGQPITLGGVKHIRVYANSGTDIKAYVAAWERIFINGLPLAAMVAQNFISAEMAVKLVSTLGAHVGDKVYNITTKDGSPVQISGGNISNGTITVSEPTATTTTTTTEGAK
ncbi:MAG: hypothetical protein HY794_13365 [Desulfarculus sp.]|nr:hypothetical protein [Desulfarculus sp.]